MTNENPIAHRKLFNDAIEDGRLRIGLPMWYQPAWCGRWLPRSLSSQESLRQYATVFSSVEGNTSFYAVPSVERLKQWRAAVSADFRFSFKIPSSVSHARSPLQALRDQRGALAEFFDEAGQSLGMLMLQLPETFSGDRMSELMGTLDCLREMTSVALSVECRHASFFRKDAVEQSLLRGLADRYVDRVIFDSRGLFNDNTESEVVAEAQRKKPRMPVHPIATGQHPVIRFIGSASWHANKKFVEQWGWKMIQWLEEGRSPYLFLHTPGNDDVPGFARWFLSQWGIELPLWPAEQQREGDLFGMG